MHSIFCYPKPQFVYFILKYTKRIPSSINTINIIYNNK